MADRENQRLVPPGQDSGFPPASSSEIRSADSESLSLRLTKEEEAAGTLWSPSLPAGRRLICRRHLAPCLACLLLAAICLVVVVPTALLVTGVTFGEAYLQRSGQISSDVHRTRFHFQPIRNWMNDPNGPMFYRGYYHLFYQYNPDAAVWGNITWGHAVSTDLLQWSYLPIALRGDRWYDERGVWSGSATMRDDAATPVIFYTGWTNESAQVVCMAVPANASDPLLRDWSKADALNPVAVAPPGVPPSAFRDPTTAWRGADATWRLLVGAELGGVVSALVFRSPDLATWRLAPRPLRSAPGRQGMWECPDFFPVAVSGNLGVDLSAADAVAPGVRHVLKASFDDTKHDRYAVGTYVEESDTWRPTDPTIDVENGRRFSYGKWYASKSFFDPSKQRRVVWGWLNESDGRQDDVSKGWASVQALPREVWLDESTGLDLIQVPVREVDSLRSPAPAAALTGVALAAGQRVELSGASGMQLDIEVSFRMPQLSAEDWAAAVAEGGGGPLPAGDRCGGKGAAVPGRAGPFGIVVLADRRLAEQTPVYFQMLPAVEGRRATWGAHVCSDHTRSSVAAGIDRSVYGGPVRTTPNDTSLHMRVIVDHSAVETFAQGGKTCITARSYPRRAIGTAARVFLFNNGSLPVTVESVTVWQMAALTFNSL